MAKAPLATGSKHPTASTVTAKKVQKDGRKARINESSKVRKEKRDKRVSAG
jgi:hypothetical protein